MRAGTIWDAVCTAVPAALHRDLPPWPNDTRPVEAGVEVFVFPETWSSSALGGGAGGQTITTAYTVIVADAMTDAAVVYGGRAPFVVPYATALKMATTHSSRRQ